MFAQAESIWVSARPNDERIPATTRSVVVRITQAKRAARMLTVSRRREVDQIVAAFNATQVVQPDHFNCGVTFPARSFSYVFRGPQERSLAHVTYSVSPGAEPEPCNPMRVSIYGRRRHELLGGPQIVHVQRMLGIKTAG